MKGKKLFEISENNCGQIIDCHTFKFFIVQFVDHVQQNIYI